MNGHHIVLLCVCVSFCVCVTHKHSIHLNFSFEFFLEKNGHPIVLLCEFLNFFLKRMITLQSFSDTQKDYRVTIHFKKKIK